MKPSELLKAAKAVIADKAKWVQGDFAVDKYGDHVMGHDPTACKFCSVGAIQKVMGRINTKKEPEKLQLAKFARLYLDKAIPVSFDDGIAVFNDSFNHREVMLLWDKAITLAEKDGK